jgi:DNA-binding FrmR family transcriptional regulator
MMLCGGEKQGQVMHDEMKTDAGETLRCEYNTRTLHRIHRIQGQLAALERIIEADEGSCEDRVIRARAIEKGMTSLITHLVECYLVNTARYDMEKDPQQTTEDLKRIFDLLPH